MLSTSSASAREVFNTYMVSQIKMDGMTKKIVEACLADDRILVCRAAKEIKRDINGTANYLEGSLTKYAEDTAKDLGVEKPIAVITYIVKVVREKKVKFNRLKLPLVNNDSGSIEMSPQDIRWSLSWNF